MVTIVAKITVEEFEQLSHAERRWELVDGELVEMSAVSTRHSVCAMRIAVRLGAFLRETGLGEVLGADTQYVVSESPATVRIPALSFISTERLAALGDRDRISRIVPDLAIEVISPNDRWREVWAKAGMWLAAGVQVVWVIDPRAQEVIALMADAPLRTFTAADELEADVLLPNFRMSIAEIFSF